MIAALLLSVALQATSDPFDLDYAGMDVFDVDPWLIDSGSDAFTDPFAFDRYGSGMPYDPLFGPVETGPESAAGLWFGLPPVLLEGMGYWDPAWEGPLPTSRFAPTEATKEILEQALAGPFTTEAITDLLRERFEAGLTPAAPQEGVVPRTLGIEFLSKEQARGILRGFLLPSSTPTQPEPMPPAQPPVAAPPPEAAPAAAPRVPELAERLMEMAQSAGMRATQDAETAARWFARIDSDGNGTVSFLEFRDKTPLSLALFRQVDEDADGEVTLAEFTSAVIGPG